MPAKTRIPAFKSERAEAEWWDAHPEVVTALFLKAKKEGKITRLPVIRGGKPGVPGFRATYTGRPFADHEFTAGLERNTGRKLAPQPGGRPKKVSQDKVQVQSANHASR